MDEIESIRNIGIVAHIDAGKTTTTERMLFYSGRTHRIGEVDDGNTITDYLEEERERGITIISAAAAFEWGAHRIHLIDTPGHIDFTAEVERSLRVIDGAVIIFSAVEGVEAQSETVWHQADHYRLPRMCFINKLDRLGASFERVLGEINDKFGDKALALQMPVGIESEFKTIVDLISRELISFEGDGGETVKRVAIPPDLADDAELARSQMVERLANDSDQIAELYLAESEIPADLIRREVRRLTLANQIVPVLCGASRRNLGVQPVIDAVVAYLPSPRDAGETHGKVPKSNKDIAFPPDPSAPFTGLVFKVRANPSADLYFLRTYSGKLKLSTKVFVPRTGETIRLKRLLRIYAQHTEPLEEVGPGDIIGFIGPKDVVTGDTLCEKHRSVVYERMTFPEPVISMALEPKSSKDRDKLDDSLSLICREDPTLNLSQDPNTGQRILSGMGELHLEINIHRLASEFGLEVKCGQPRVAYRETVQKPVAVTTTFQRFIGEQELLAGVTLSLAPAGNLKEPFQITESLHGDAPKDLLAAALQAISDGLKTGGNFGYPLINVSAELKELAVSGEKTTDGAVLGAVLQALDEAIREAGTVILEPIMRLEILAPEDCLGEISNDIQRRHGVITNVVNVMALKRVVCEVPLAEMFGFSKALPKLTGGRGSFSMEPSGYRTAECNGTM